MVQELVFLTEQTGFSDWAGDLKWGTSIHSDFSNILLDRKGKLVFVDTEWKSFSAKQTRLELLQRLQLFLKNSERSITPKGLDYIDARIIEIQYTEYGKTLPVFFCRDFKYQDEDLDLEKVYEQFHQMRDKV